MGGRDRSTPRFWTRRQGRVPRPGASLPVPGLLSSLGHQPLGLTLRTASMQIMEPQLMEEGLEQSRHRLVSLSG